MRKSLGLLSIVLGGFGLSSHLSAATITFGAPTSINGNGTNSVLDVNYPNPVVQAGWFGTTSTTVSAPLSGTIQFDPIASTTAAPSGTTTKMFQSGGPERNNNAIFTNSGSLVASDLKNVLTQHVYETANTTPSILQLGGLTVGQAYSVQLFAIDDRNATKTEQFRDTAGGTGSNSAAFNSNADDYVLASFTADANTQLVYIINPPQTSGHDLNAFVLRAVPEPGTVALLGMAALPLLARRNRRKA